MASFGRFEPGSECQFVPNILGSPLCSEGAHAGSQGRVVWKILEEEGGASTNLVSSDTNLCEKGTADGGGGGGAVAGLLKSVGAVGGGCGADL